MTYKEFVCSQLNEYRAGQPIYTSDISTRLAAEYGLQPREAAAAVAVAMKRIMGDGALPDLRFYQKGIYYLPAVTPFGEMGIDKECLIADKYLLPNNGYETGFAALYHMGLTSQLPRERCLVTNKAKDCARKDAKLGVVIRPPKTPVNEYNKAYLQFLDILELVDRAPIDAKQPYVLLAKHIEHNGLIYERLLSLADQYYNKGTILQLAHTANAGNVK